MPGIRACAAEKPTCRVCFAQPSPLPICVGGLCHHLLGGCALVILNRGSLDPTLVRAAAAVLAAGGAAPSTVRLTRNSKQPELHAVGDATDVDVVGWAVAVAGHKRKPSHGKTGQDRT